MSTHLPLFGEALSNSEKQVYALVASALPNKTIASQLHITEGTVKHHVGVIMKKLGLKNRVQLALNYHGIAIANSSLPPAEEPDLFDTPDPTSTQ